LTDSLPGNTGCDTLGLNFSTRTSWERYRPKRCGCR